MTPYPKAVADGWHPVAAVKQLGAKPLARTLMGRPLVVFAATAGPAVLLDRCPHRNMPLSAGKVYDGQIRCPYHGWQFDGTGRCTLVPGSSTPASAQAEVLPVQVHAGLVFTSLSAAPPTAPTLPTPIGADDVDSFVWPVRATRARLVDAVENLLDPAHPHFLHPGIVRSASSRRPVEVTVKLHPAHAEAVYLENAQARALMPRLLEGERYLGIGRFFPPSIGQLAFESPKGLKLAITVFFTPEGPDRVRPFAHFATPRGPLPAWLKQLVLRAFHIPVLAQDQAALARQAEQIEKFGQPRYALGPLDLLLPAIQALMDDRPLTPSERVLTLAL